MWAGISARLSATPGWRRCSAGAHARKRSPVAGVSSRPAGSSRPHTASLTGKLVHKANRADEKKTQTCQCFCVPLRNIAFVANEHKFYITVLSRSLPFLPSPRNQNFFIPLKIVTLSMHVNAKVTVRENRGQLLLNTSPIMF